MRILITVILVLAFLKPSFAQSPDYGEIFGNDWEKAVLYENQNHGWIDSLLSKYHVSYQEAMSVVFPEIVRYSALKDKIETGLLMTLYVNLGEDYANFSIGVLQMKPTFAEYIRENSISVKGKRPAIKFERKTDFDDIKAYRKSIIKDLRYPEGQFRYLIVFMRLCDKKFNTGAMDETARIKFLSTAYNYGIDRTYEEIVSMVDKKYFNTKLIKTKNYAYSDVALYRYSQYSSGIK